MNDRRKSLKSAGVLLLMLLLITGCSMKEPQQSLESVQTPSVEEQEGFEEVDTTVDPSENAGITMEYSKKDLETAYDETSATKIVFSGEALVTGEGAETEGKNVTITKGGNLPSLWKLRRWISFCKSHRGGRCGADPKWSGSHKQVHLRHQNL